MLKNSDNQWQQLLIRSMLLLLCGSQFAWTQVVLQQNTTYLSVGNKTSFYEDRSHKASIQDIVALDKQGKFVASSMAIPNFGFKPAKLTYWAKIEIINATLPIRDFTLDLAFGNMSHVDFYILYNNHLINKYQLGDFLGKKGRIFNYFGYAIKLPTKPQLCIYVRMQPYSGQALFPFSISELQTFYNLSQEVTLIWGGYLGILIMVLIYHLVLYWRTREEGFRRLIIYLGLYLGFEISRGLGIGPRYLWYNSPLAVTYAAYFFSTLSLFAFLEFYAYVTQTFEKPAHNQYIIRIAQLGCVVLGTVGYFTEQIGQNVLMYLQGIWVGFGALLISSNAIRRGNKAAWYYLLAVLSIYGGGLIQSIHRTGVFGNSDNWLLRYSINVGSLCEIILLSLGIAETVRQERKKRKLAELQAQKEIENRTTIVEEAQKVAKSHEFNRMATELHNNVGNMVILIRQALNDLRPSVTEQQQAQKLTSINELVAQTYEQIRALSHSEKSNSLQKRTLNQALQELIEAQNRFDNSPHFLYSMKGSDTKLTETMQLDIYSICTELVNNIVKHAHATTASIKIQITDQEVILVVTDNGVGIQPNASGFGLQQIHRKKTQLNATLVIESLQTGGTQVILCIPLGELA